VEKQKINLIGYHVWKLFFVIFLIMWIVAESEVKETLLPYLLVTQLFAIETMLLSHINLVHKRE
tara:strand:+ start:543 stop:734 length:192 start_codon:yes stop_codon:yes gene_type:complete